MKIASLILSALTMSALSANAFTCTDRNPRSNEKLEVTVQQLADITDKVTWADELDKVTVVKVTIDQIIDGRRTTLASFESIAKYADVAFNVSAVKKQGFRMWRYFDEENEDGMELTSLRDGKAIDLRCTYDQ